MEIRKDTKNKKKSKRYRVPESRGKEISIPTKTEIDELLFAVRTSSPSEARVNRLHRRKVFTLFNEGKKGSKGGRIGLLFEKGPLSERDSFSTLPSATSAVPQEWICLLSCPLLERIVNVSSYFCEVLSQHYFRIFFYLVICTSL